MRLRGAAARARTRPQRSTKAAWRLQPKRVRRYLKALKATVLTISGWTTKEIAKEITQ